MSDLSAIDGATDRATSDVALLRAWQAGDRDAGAALFDRYYDGVVRFFRNKVNDSDRDDIVQQTFLAVSGADFAERSSVKTWIFSIAWRRLKDHHRRQARRDNREIDLDVVSVMDLGTTPEARLVRGEERRLLLEGLRRLPVHQQAVLELHYWEGMTAPRIAEVLGVALGTAKTRLRDGRLRLAKTLATIARSPEVLKSTLDDLDGWAKRAGELGRGSG